MTKHKQLAFLALMFILLIGCKQDTYYERPTWLVGKVYTQIKTQTDLSTFTKCIELTGYDKIIDVSGSYTLFAPSNDAFAKYFQENPKYKSVEDIPISELTELVKYHIVQNPWSKVQLRSLDVYGWIDTLDINNDKPKGFKRETLLLKKDINVGVRASLVDNVLTYSIIDTLTTNWKRRILTDSRKFVPLFYKEYFNIYNLNIADYQYYFNRSFENNSDIYYANAKIVGDEIFAENGFIYNIDRVVVPLRNGYEILSDIQGANSYTDFLKLVNIFPRFVYNEQKTFAQEGADQGLIVDSLFDLTYPELTFSINNEKTKAPSGTMGLPSNVTIRYHNGLIAPTNSALNELLNEYVNGAQHWGNINNAPVNIKRIIVNSYMSENPIFESDFQKGFYNGELDIVKLNEADIVQKEFGSNTTFVGLKKPIIPRAFKSVTGPVYTRQGYSVMMNAIERTGLLPALKRENQNYSLFVENDFNLLADSSLLYDAFTRRFQTFQVGADGTATAFPPSTSDLRTLILNQVGVERPNGLARKEFIKNLAGNYLIFNNVTGVVSGTDVSTDGYNGAEIVDIIPRQISSNADNGTTYDVGDFFRFAAADIYAKISGSYPNFHALLVSAGLANTAEYRYTFLSENEFYTVFIPSNEAISKFDFSKLTNDQFRKLLMLHFVQGKMVFTDGNSPTGYYETTRVDEKSTPYTTIYSKIHIKTGYDVINLLKKGGSNYTTIDESPTCNIIVGRNIAATGTSPVFPQIVSTAVIHQNDKKLLF